MAMKIFFKNQMVHSNENLEMYIVRKRKRQQDSNLNTIYLLRYIQIQKVASQPFETNSVCEIKKKYVKQHCYIFGLCFFPPNIYFKSPFLSSLHLILKAAFFIYVQKLDFYTFQSWRDDPERIKLFKNKCNKQDFASVRSCCYTQTHTSIQLNAL